ncbi:CPBP family glutamic-type intramembrane protease [Microbacterium sp. HD4P20]|uniref:CPBP family glutamic-type intramembrane protease n=1 Tax=Microbacterium sp. HD4P20 TaxID=2864874 RepID=UPI001C63ECBD|nr:CPBP family glutamic-type intramembrane protease [Microbacterium sp. HD4P20]MCP2638124.1 CPBP family glutamic-type intramembrane protease [Microbacterium sp. HD4P20]
MTPGASPGSSSFYRRPWIALLVAAAGVVIAGLVVSLYRGIGATGWIGSLADLVIISVPFVLAAVVAIRLAATPGFVRRVLLRWRWTDVAFGLGVGLLVRALLELLVPTTGSLLGGFGTVSIAAVAVIALGAALVTPIVEELFFRGVAVAALLDVFGSLGRVVAAVASVAVSTAAFVALHVVAAGGMVTWGALLGPLAIGVGCGILFAVTGRVAAGICAHVVSNAIGVALLLV